MDNLELSIHIAAKPSTVYRFLSDAKLFVTGFNRPNIHYTIRPSEQARKQLLAFLAKRKESGIIYCHTICLIVMHIYSSLILFLNKKKSIIKTAPIYIGVVFQFIFNV